MPGSSSATHHTDSERIAWKPAAPTDLCSSNDTNDVVADARTHRFDMLLNRFYILRYLQLWGILTTCAK